MRENIRDADLVRSSDDIKLAGRSRYDDDTQKKTTCFNYQGPKSKGTNVRRKTACIIFKIVKKSMFHFQDSEKNSIFLSQDSEKYSLNHFQDSQKNSMFTFQDSPRNKMIHVEDRQKKQIIQFGDTQ